MYEVFSCMEVFKLFGFSVLCVSLRLRVTQKALQLSFCFFSFSSVFLNGSKKGFSYVLFLVALVPCDQYQTY